MLADELWENYLVLDQADQVSLNQYFDIQISESQMHQIKQFTKITSLINRTEANEIYKKQQSLKQINRWRNQESELYKWIMVKLFFKTQFNITKIVSYYITMLLQPKQIWVQVGLYISKSPQQLQKKWQEYTLSSVNVFKHWTIEEDNVLQQLVKQLFMQNKSFHQQCKTKISWSKIGNQFNEQSDESFRSGKKCRDRWFNFLDPQIMKQKWNDHDIQQLFLSVKNFGKKWLKIGGLMLRTENDVKNKFYWLIHKYKPLTGHKITKGKLIHEQRIKSLKQVQSTPCDVSEYLQFEQEDLYLLK